MIGLDTNDYGELYCHVYCIACVLNAALILTLIFHVAILLTNYSNGEYKIAYEMFKNKNNGCKKHSQGIYLAEVGAFAEAYALQSQYESLYTYGENQYGNPDSLDYTSCTAFEEANDDGSFTYVKLGCSDAGGLKLFTYSDNSCTVEITNNIGVYNDMKVRVFVLSLLINVCSVSVSNMHQFCPCFNRVVDYYRIMCLLYHQPIL